MSFAQTLMHYKLGHHPIGGKFFRNHINFHHRYYSKDHLLSRHLSAWSVVSYFLRYFSSTPPNKFLRFRRDNYINDFAALARL
jgi:hypothetical protein